MKHNDLLKWIDELPDGAITEIQTSRWPNVKGVDWQNSAELKQLAADYRRAIAKLELYADPENWVCRCDLFPNIPDYEPVHVCKADYFTGGNPRGKDVAAEFLKSIGEGE